MPLEKRNVEPKFVSRGAGHGEDDVSNELECTTNTTLANVILQLSSLSRHADDLFAELCQQVVNLQRRSSTLNGRIQRLGVKVTQLDSNVEEVSLQDINLRKAFKATSLNDQQVVSRETIPTPMLETLAKCDPPPPLDKLNVFREDGKDGLKFYTDPTYFFELWRQDMLNDADKIKQDKHRKPKHHAHGHHRHGKRSSHSAVRQPKDTKQHYREIAIRGGEILEDSTDQQQARPNSLELQSNYQHHHPESLYAHNHLQQQQNLQLQQQDAYDSVGQQSQPPPYNTVQHEQQHQQPPPPPYSPAPPPPVAAAAVSPMSTSSSPTRNYMRPSQAPPPPPPSGSSSSRESTPSHSRAHSVSRDHLPPPPPPPPLSNGSVHFHQSATGTPTHNMDNLPPPPSPPPSAPTPDMSPPQQINGVPPPPPPPPPPPMPTIMANGPKSDLNTASFNHSPQPGTATAVTTILESDHSRHSSGERQLQTANSSSSSLRSTSGTRLKKVQHNDNGTSRSDLLSAIQKGINLRKVEEKKQKIMQDAGGANAALCDVASILARRVAVEYSDTENSTDSDADYDSEDWAEETTA